MTDRTVLKDIMINDPESLKGKMAHVEIIDGDLVITIDFQQPRIAAMQYLQLKGHKWHDKMKEKIDEIVPPPTTTKA